LDLRPVPGGGLFAVLRKGRPWAGLRPPRWASRFWGGIGRFPRRFTLPGTLAGMDYGIGSAASIRPT
jgi:hypothetical protein